MKRKITTTIKRMVSFGLVLAMMLTCTNVYAAEGEVTPVDSTDEQEYATSITYDVETGEITYGADQNYTSEGADSAETDGVNGEEISPTGIIGPDDRIAVSNTTVYPYNAICYVESTFPNGTVRRGTGSLVHSTVMLTSGDMVYSHDNGGWAKAVTVIPALNSDGYNRPYGTAHATKLTSNDEWSNNKNVLWDWGIVDLDTSFNSWLGVSYNNDYTLYIGLKASTVGYPKNKGFQMWQDTNSISAAGDRYLKTLCDIEYGDNGAPVMSLDSGRIVGIIATEHLENGVCYYNSAVRINADLYNRIQAHIQSK